LKGCELVTSIERVKYPGERWRSLELDRKDIRETGPLVLKRRKELENKGLSIWEVPKVPGDRIFLFMYKWMQKKQQGYKSHSSTLPSQPNSIFL
jgi:hypothetical protein